jgi:hypothetical protein
MKIFTTLCLLLATLFLGQTVLGQSVLDPTDPVTTYNGSTTPAQPADGTIGKWIRTKRLSWNTDSFKCYIYKGVPFRLRFPKSYKPGVSDGKKYPMLVFFHGLGEVGAITDNEYQMYHGGDVFNAAVSNGTYDGYVFFMQSRGYWGVGHYQYIKEIIDYMIANNKLDPFEVTVDGLSAGGQGTWGMVSTYPTYISAALPISHAEIGYTDNTLVNTLKFTPIWNTEGGLDGSPAPATGEQVRDAFNAVGANFQYKEYPTLGHGCWDSVWKEPNFWPFMNNSYMANPWTLFGRSQFCPGDPINITLGLVPGLQAYQWRKDGVLLSATTNSIQVTTAGTYDARVERNGVWSDWSRTPVVVGIKPPTVTPPISISGLMSSVLPGADGLNYVNLQVPDSGYTSYSWKQVGGSAIIGTTRILKVTQPGQYIVAVTQQFGCSSIYSAPFTVASASGPNPPSAATSLIATPLSFTQMQLNWARNPNPTNKETGFEIYRATTSGGPYTYIGLAPADTVNYIDNNLKPNVKYYYIVRAVDASAAAPASNEAGAVTQSDQTPPSAPANLRVTTSTPSSISLAWDPSTDNVGVANYAVYVNGTKRTTTSQTSYIVDGLTASTLYSFYVIALDGSGNASAKSNQVSAPSVYNGLQYSYYTTAAAWSVLPNFSTLTPVTVGTMPNVSIANATQSTNFGYLWQGYINIPVAGTYIFATTSDDGSALWFNTYTPTGTPLVNNDGGHASQTKTGSITLQPGVYPICIEYFQGGGGSSMSISWACSALFGNTTQRAIADSYFKGTYSGGGIVPAVPTQLKATAQSYYKIGLTWTDNSANETGFEIYRATSFGGPYSIVTTTGANATSFTDSSVAASTTYYYRVQAINATGASGFDSTSLGGLQYAYYTFTGSWTNMSGLNALTPAKTGTLTNISLSPATATSNYAFKYQGSINIPATGSYTFYTASDDGSDLYIGGYDSAHMVVKNDFLQGTTERSGTLTLAKGSYPFYVTYFQSGGGAALTASIQGPTITKKNIPDSLFVNGNSTATTFALPALPSAPTGLTATAVSPTATSLGWQNSAGTATGFFLYRSVGDTLHFVKLASLPLTPTSYSDTGLFANQAYYYKLAATGVGGNSAYSSIVSATTLDNPPVITKLGDRTAHYGVTSTLTVSATDVNDEAISFSIRNNPSFVTLADNGNKTATLTFSPGAGDQNVYTGITVVAKDIHGGSDSTKFNLTVNDNYDPVMAAISNYTLGENDTLSIPLSATDQNSGDNLTWSVTNAPPGLANITAGSNGSAVLGLRPNFSGSGTFAVSVTVNDGHGGQVVRQFNVTVNQKDPNLKIYSRIKSALTAPAPWNNLTGAVTNNLVDANGNTTSVGINIQANSWAVNNEGPNTGNNTGIYPDAVLNEFLYFGLTWQQQTVNGVISGLDTAKKYNITFYAGSNSTIAPNNGSTNFTIGSQTVSLAVQNNTLNTVSINSQKPAADGTITFTMAKGTGATAGYLNAVVISNLYDDGTIPAAPTGLTAQSGAGAGVLLSWTNAAYNAGGFQVFRSTSASGGFAAIATLNGTDLTRYTDTTATSNTVYYYEVAATNVHGTSGYSNVVSLTAPGHAPSIAPLGNVTLKNNASTTFNVTATGDASDHLTLAVSNLPSFVTFTDNGNGTGTFKVIPKGVTGVFPGVTVTATNMAQLSTSTSFDISVTDKDVASVYINFSDGIFLGSKPWNNMTAFPNAGASLSNLMDDANTPSGMTVSTLDNFEGVLDRGMHPGNGTTVYPETVMESAFFESSANSKRIQISGLSTTKKYNFVFFNSHDFGLKTTTNFTINGTTVSLDGTYNLNKTVQINGIRSDANGKVVITMAKASGTDLGLITSLVIQAYDTTKTLLSPTDLRIVEVTKNALKLQWADRAFDETGYEVWRAPDAAGSQFTLLKTLPAGTTSYKDSALSSNATFYYTVRAVKSGVYSTYTNVASAATYSSNVYVQLTGVFDAPSPWNPTNMTPVAGNEYDNFLNDLQAPTSTSLVVTNSFSEVNPLGMNTGNNSGRYPDNLLTYSYFVFPGVTGGIKLTGLNTGLKYNLGIIASNAGFGDLNTRYTYNGKDFYLNASMNLGYGKLNIPVQPDSNGEISFTVAPGGSSTGTSGCINAFILSNYVPAAYPAPVAPYVNSKPIIGQITNKTMPQNTTLVVPVTATDADGDTLTYTIQNAPSYGTFVDNGNGSASLTLNPTSSGTTSGIKIKVSDGKGGADSTTFSVTVNNNLAPTIAAGYQTSYSVQEGSPLAISLTATDPNSDVMTWTVTGLPNTYSLSSPTNGAENIALTPNAGTAGTYSVVATVSDGKGGTAAASFTVTVTKKANNAIYTRIAQSASLGTPWNNLNTQTTNNLKDADGNTTAVGITLPLNPWAANSQGANTGNNSGVYPDAVLTDFLYFGLPWQQSTVTGVLTGLNTGATYSITFFASSNSSVAADNGNTNYTIGGQTVSLYVQNNTQNTVTINNVTPAADGTITFTMAKGSGATAGYVNAIIIKPNTTGDTGANTRLGSGLGQALSPDSTTAVPIVAYPNPFHQSFKLAVTAKQNDRVMVSMYAVSGQQVYAKEFDNLHDGTNTLTIDGGSQLSLQGVYIVKVIFLDGKRSATTRVIRQ